MLPPDMQWMNWGGWHWVSLIMVAALYFYFGWSMRGTHERFKRFREDHAAWKEQQRKAAADEMEGPDADENLRAGCQRCHLNYDAGFHAVNAAAISRKKSPQRDMLDEAVKP